MLANVAIYFNYLPTILWLGKMHAFHFTSISFSEEKKNLFKYEWIQHKCLMYSHNSLEYKMPLGLYGHLKIACKGSLEIYLND